MDFPHPKDTDTPIVYIREIAVDALPDEIRAQIGDATEVWGVLTPEGECVALAKDRRTAFVVARVNEYAPVSVH